MYYEYWGMNRHPFDNVPDPTMYFRAHESVETAVAEVLFAIEEGDEVLAVVVGEVGLGKTTSLRVILDSLDQAKYRIAFVTNPDVSFSMLLRDIVGQLRGETCETRHKDDLLEEFNRVLFETADEGKRVLIFIDEGNAFKPANLESLRLLTNMQEDDRNLFTIVLAGQPKLARMLEAPSRANLFQRIGVYCRLTRMESWQVVRDYVDHRLERAGAKERIFTDDAVKAVYHYSENGVPRLVNKIAKLALKAGETNDTRQVGREIVEAVGERFRRFTREAAEPTDDASELKVEKPKKARKRAKAQPVDAVTEETIVAGQEQSAPTLEHAPMRAAAEGGEDTTVSAESTLGFYGSAASSFRQQQKDFTDRASFYPGDDQNDENAPPQNAEEAAAAVSPVQVCMDDLMRTGALDKARGASKLERMKMAGQLAADEIKKHPEVVSLASDPVTMWKELRNEILTAVTAGATS